MGTPSDWLHGACRADNLEEVMRLLSKGVDIHIRNDAGWTPLHSCAFKGRTVIALYLISAGADINARTEKQETPLHLAVKRDTVEMLRLLIDKGADIDAADMFRHTALRDACLRGYNDAARVLLKAGASIRAPYMFWSRSDDHGVGLISRGMMFVPLLARTNIPADLIREFTNYV